MKKKGSECKKVFFVNPVNLFFKKFEIFQTISACKCLKVLKSKNMKVFWKAT